MKRKAWNSGVNSAKTKKALALIGPQMTAYAAARKVGIALSTIYRCLKRQRER